MLDWWLRWIRGVLDRYHIPVRSEVLSKDGVVGFADLAALQKRVSDM